MSELHAQQVLQASLKYQNHQLRLFLLFICLCEETGTRLSFFKTRDASLDFYSIYTKE